jgi:hypothetical protein
MDGMLPLVTGTLLAIAALMLVLSPLVSGSSASPTMSEQDRRSNDARIADEEEQGSAIAALREIEFDRATGKLSDADYEDLKQRYTRAAIAELRGDSAATVTPASAAVVSSPRSIDDAVDAAIARARASRVACDECGPRPEWDATYCSNCGKQLQ